MPDALSDPRRAPVRYHDVLRDPEYRAVFAADGLSTLGDQVTRLAVALLVFDRTGSALAAAATYACGFLAWIVGGPALSALADRLPRRRLMITCDLARGALVLVLLLPGLPLWFLFAILVASGLLAPPFDSARSALLADILEGDRYVFGNALSQSVGQVGQVAGFVLGGALVAFLGTRGALLVDAGTFALSAVLLWGLVRDRAVPDRTGAAPALRVELSAGLHLVLGTHRLRVLLGWGVLIAMMTIAPEGLAVTVAADLGGGAAAAGILTAAVPAGFLVGSVAVLRLPPPRREWLFPWLTVLSGLALATTPWLDSLWLVATVWAVAGIGTALQLIANSAFVQAVPPQLRGRAFGVAGTLLMATQGLVLLGAGAMADRIGAQTTVAVVAVAGLLVLGLAAAAGRPRRRGPQVARRIARGTSG